MGLTLSLNLNSYPYPTVRVRTTTLGLLGIGLEFRFRVRVLGVRAQISSQGLPKLSSWQDGFFWPNLKFFKTWFARVRVKAVTG